MIITVIGCGFVGSTVANFLEKNGIDVERVDPKYYDTTLEQALRISDGAIMCLPTPTVDGACDDSYIADVFSEINEKDLHVPIMNKSTVTPDIIKNWPEYVLYNPEFLREANAEEDFENQHTFIMGATDTYDGKNTVKFWKQIFEPLLPNCEFIVTDRSTASMTKYAHNAFLATKVAFFHELVIKNIDVEVKEEQFNYDELTYLLGRFDTIGNNHMKAPNAEGRFGFGGNCFPKDVAALTNYYQKHGTPATILEQVTETNNMLKKENRLNYNSDFPKVPYMVCIGTSHTYGECNGVRTPYTFNNIIGEKLGLEVVNVGLSGAMSNEIMQLVNELDYKGVFGDNCKFVMLEPRVTDNSYKMYYEQMIDWLDIRSKAKQDSLLDIPLLERSALGPDRTWDNGSIRFNQTLNDMLYLTGQQNSLNKEHIEMNGQASLEEFYQAVPPSEIDAAFNAAEYQLAFQNKTMAVAFEDMQIVDIIKNMICSKNIPFAWTLIDSRYQYLEELKEIFNNKSDVFDYMLLGESVNNVIQSNLQAEQDTRSLRDLQCECHHYNSDGHQYVANILYPHVDTVIKNKN